MDNGASSTPWTRLWQFRTPVDPQHGGPTSTAALWRDNLGGLVLGMDDRDGESTLILPLSAADADDLAAAIHEHRTTPMTDERCACLNPAGLRCTWNATEADRLCDPCRIGKPVMGDGKHWCRSSSTVAKTDEQPGRPSCCRQAPSARTD